MKKFIAKALTLSLAIGTLASSFVNVNAAEKEKITLWGSGSDNVKMALESVKDKFNASEDGKKYELEIQWITSGSGVQGLRDRVLAAAKAGETDTDYDIIELGADEFKAYTNEVEDVFVPLDFSKIPNIERVAAELAEGKEFLSPYRGTTVVLAYDSERVKEVPKTAEELYQWIKDHPGKFAYNTPSSGGAGGSFAVTAIYNFLDEAALQSADEANMEQWTQGFDLLKELHPYLYQSGGKTVYPHKNQGTLDLLANQQVDMIPAWADMAISQTTEGRLPETTKIAQIDPSFTGNLVTFAMPNIGSKSEGVYAVMNFMLSDEAQQILLDELAAIPLVETQFESKNAEMLKDISVEAFRRASIGDLTTKLYEKWDSEIGTLE
ncbi:extracellular solute-binding protein [Ignavigranum ruoffiae]|uniref:Putative spermidine/putrescine transport system substrate-binding protein n=1 Tax=Ignavigranum ruoffiae TaxID=89093 RepID=A0A1H8ZAN9_9LACT|nr:extracellular solute-binding protein [Ignavigranum ruoffiae]SEP61495.1 putative spermidine/putrescine transport system substrate-binding protein [Ignavigranum ruoffiae]